MKLSANLPGCKIQGRAIGLVVDAATGKIIREHRAKNLVYDSGLNLLANGQSDFSDFFSSAAIGTGNRSDQIASGTTLFTQAGTAIICTVGQFFTPAMVGGIFKYGTGTAGIEQYITAVTGSPVGGFYPGCTVAGSGQTVLTGTVATVWLVQNTALQTPLLVSTTYLSSIGAYSSGFTFPGGTNVVQQTRIIKFPVQGSPYNVTEVGYRGNNTPSGQVNGRVSFSPGDPVATSQFYVLVWILTYTQNLGSPRAVADKGTNIVTAGMAMFQAWSFVAVQPNGTGAAYQGSTSIMDSNSDSPAAAFHVGTAISLQSTIQANNAVSTDAEPFGLSLGGWATTTAAGSGNSNVAIGTSTSAFSFTTAGQSLNAIVVGNGNASFCQKIFVLNLTTPVPLPTGSFSGSISFQRTFGRSLNN